MSRRAEASVGFRSGRWSCGRRASAPSRRGTSGEAGNAGRERVGLRDWLRRMGRSGGARREGARGRRRPRLAERRPDAPTAQMGAAPAGGPAAPPGGPEREAARPAPPPTERAPSLAPPSPEMPASGGAPPPAAAAASGSGPPRDPAPAPSAPAEPASPPASAAPPSGDPGATRYHAIPDVAKPRVAGVLVAVDGELAGELYRVSDGETRLGRSPECEAVLQSEWISRQHARIRHQDGVFVIAPLSDKNPTIVNDEPTEGRELEDGDFVRLGRTTLRFRSVL